MRLIYNGVEIKVLRTLRYGRRAVYDTSGQEQLYTEWDIMVMGAVNPFATSYQGGIGRAPAEAAGVPPILTDVAIRHRLLEHRKQLLILGEDGNEELRCPRDDRGYRLDAKGGPFPRDFDVVEVSGIPKTFLVYYHIQCYVDECRDSGQSAVSSHRWRQRSDVDTDHFAVRVTEGEVVFNVAELDRLGRSIDQYRQDFLHPVPLNFQREHVSVTITEDATRAVYTVVDREKSHVLNPNHPATRIEAYHTEHIGQPSLADVGTKLIRAGMQKGRNLMDLAAGPFGPAAAGLAGALEIAIMAFDTLVAGMPQAYSHMFVRAWGDRNTARRDLGQFAMQLALGRLFDFRLAFLPSVDATLTRDLAGKFVEFQLLINHPPSLVSFGAAFATSLLMDVDNERLDGFAGAFPNAVNPGNGVNPPFPADAGSRGTWAGNILAQLLEAPCTNPAAPFNATFLPRTRH